MSKILVLGPTGTGKSASLRNLDPFKTKIVNCDKKELPLKGAKTVYMTKRESGTNKVILTDSNYVENNKPVNVATILKEWEKDPTVTTLVIDTITHLITADYIQNTIGKDYKAYQMLGKNFYEIIELIRDSKKNVIVYAHSSTRFNDMGDKVTEMQVLGGKMISELVPPSYFSTVLMTDVEFKDGRGNYRFRTQSTGNHDPVKSPGHEDGSTWKTALEYHEPNDIALILDKLEKFESL